TPVTRTPPPHQRAQPPPPRPQRDPRSTPHHPSNPRLAVPSRRPARAKPLPQKKKPSPNPRPATQTASRIPIHNVKEQRTEDSGRRTEESSRLATPAQFQLPSDSIRSSQSR